MNTELKPEVTPAEKRAARSKLIIAAIAIAISLGLWHVATSDPKPPSEKRELVDTLKRNHDCVGLQIMFDNADIANDTTMMKYADSAMKDASCYG